MKKVAVIVPAYNEEARIGRVLDALCRASLVHEVIVVCDGGTDNTAKVAATYEKVRVIDLPANIGKGGAMCVGVAATHADVIAFVDADLIGMKPEHIDRIVHPILSGGCDMCIGVFRGGQFWSDTAQRISPYISGQRAMTRKLFESIPYLDEIRMGVEVTINTYAKRQKVRVQRVVLHGVSNTFKEKKLGIVKGTAARTRMYAEIARAMVRVHRKKKGKRVRVGR